MKKSPFKIYIDRLKQEETEKIYEQIDADFLEVQEKDLSFSKQITLSGQAYLAKNHLILELKIKVNAFIPCSICNVSVEVSLQVENFYHTKDLSEFKSAVYDYTEEVRSAILLKVPHFIECNQGNCPERKELIKFLKNDTTEIQNPQTLNLRTPFSHLL